MWANPQPTETEKDIHYHTNLNIHVIYIHMIVLILILKQYYDSVYYFAVSIVLIEMSTLNKYFNNDTVSQ